MTNLAGRIAATSQGSRVVFVIVAIAIASSLSLNSCRDKFITQVDTLIKRDTLIKTLPRDTVIVHDTVDLDDSSVWVYRTSGTTEGLIVSQFVSGKVGFVGGTNGIILGSDGSGSNWQTLNANIGTSGLGGTAVYALSFLDAQNGFALGDGQSVYHTADGGKNWSQASSNSSFFLRTISMIDATNGFIGTSDWQDFGTGAGRTGEILQTHDGGQTWNLAYSSATGGIYHVQFLSPTIGVALGRFGTALWTADGGATWTVGTTDQPANVLFHCTFTTATTGFAVAYGDPTHGYVLRTDDAGHTWRTIRSLPFGLQSIANNGNGIITACGFVGSITESTDGGTTWTESHLGTDRWLNVNYASKDRLVMIGSLGHVVTRDK